MRANEFLLRQKVSASRAVILPEQKQEIVRLAKTGTSKKALTVIFGVTYQEIKAFIREVS